MYFHCYFEFLFFLHTSLFLFNKFQVDSYSAFYDNGGFLQTELHSTLQSAEIDTVIITGLATDYCVKYTAIDAKKLCT